jgi:hypothetical protein
MILVIAVNENHFKHWCREVGLNDHPTSVKYVFSPEQLRGLIGRPDIEILSLPEWYSTKPPSVITEFNLLIKEHWKRKEAK